MEILWEHPGESGSAGTIREVAETLDISPVIAGILHNRGLHTAEQARAFFTPSLSDLQDPLRMADMGLAVDALIGALTDRRRIVVYGDYDVDGVTSVALLYLVLKDLGGQVSYRIPERQNDGYGLSESAIRECWEQGDRLLVTVDTGITAVEQIRYARELGMDVIICDHHRPGDSLPDANAILNPKVESCGYPFRELAAVGVAFKLAQALGDRLQMDEDLAFRYLDLAALGSAADIVPLLGENRILVSLGLDKLNTQPLTGIRALLDVAGPQGREVDVSQIIFGLAPRINAVGRMGNAERAVELLTTQNRSRAREIAQVLESENSARKCIDQDTLGEALKKVEREVDLENDRVIVLHQREWHCGVIGIVASRIIEKYHRPTVLISVDEHGVGKGSARSIPGFDIYSALHESRDLLEQFGGHMYAAGLTIQEHNIPEFARRLKAHCAAHLSASDLLPRLVLAAEIPLSAINRAFVETLARFAPHGPRNPKPLFLTRGVQAAGAVRLVGNGHLHLRVQKEGYEFDAIGYGLGRHEPLLAGCPLLDIVYSVEDNVWQGRRSIQLHLKDICPAGARRIEETTTARELPMDLH
jgi:single-stranded-DNA-specific exonuclease